MVCPEHAPIPSTTGIRRPYLFKYRNHRNEVAIRSVIPMEIFYGKTEFYPEEQWLMTAFDLDRDLPRTFAMNRINVE